MKLIELVKRLFEFPMGYETFRGGALRFLQHYFTVNRPNKLVVVVALEL